MPKRPSSTRKTKAKRVARLVTKMETKTEKAPSAEAESAAGSQAEPPKPQTAGAAPKTESESQGYRINDAQAFGRNLAHVAAKSQLLLSEFLQRQTERMGHEPVDPLNVSGAFFTLFKEMAAHP